MSLGKGGVIVRHTFSLLFILTFTLEGSTKYLNVYAFIMFGVHALNETAIGHPVDPSKCELSKNNDLGKAYILPEFRYK